MRSGIAVGITAANTHDTKGAKRLVKRVARFYGDDLPDKVLVDRAYRGEKFRKTVWKQLEVKVEIGTNLAKAAKKFISDGDRWPVERTFAWLLGYRRLDKDQERLARHSRAMVTWAFVNLLLNRLTGAKSEWKKRG